MKKQFDQPKFNPNVHTHGCQPAEGCQSENKIHKTGWPSENLFQGILSRELNRQNNLFSFQNLITNMKKNIAAHVWLTQNIEAQGR
jgi:hypothetical protein